MNLNTQYSNLQRTVFGSFEQFLKSWEITGKLPQFSKPFEMLLNNRSKSFQILYVGFWEASIVTCFVTNSLSDGATMIFTKSKTSNGVKAVT